MCVCIYIYIYIYIYTHTRSTEDFFFFCLYIFILSDLFLVFPYVCAIDIYEVCVREGKLWTYTYPSNSNTQLEFILRNKWINSALNCEEHSLLKGYFPITESSQQRYAWVCVGIINCQNLVTTGPRLPIEI